MIDNIMKYSKLPRLYMEDELSPDKLLLLNNENYNYLKNVLRLKNGFKLRVFNEKNGEFIANFDSDGKILLTEQFRNIHQYQPKITLLASIIKQDKFELICDMATQIGVTSIIPIITIRVQKKDINYERLNKIILEATRQSERFDIPKLNQAIELKEIKNLFFDKIYFANEQEQREFKNSSNLKNIAALIGPEGGFTDEEINFLNNLSNVESISLGHNVLRAETASIALLSKIIII